MARHPQLDAMLKLAEQQCDGLLDAVGLQRLEALLAGDAEMRGEYLRYVYLHAHLNSTDAIASAVYDEEHLRQLTDRDELEACLAELSDASHVSVLRHHDRTQSHRRRVWVSATAFAAAGVLLTGLLLFLFFVPPPGNEAFASKAIAQVTGVAGVKWLDDEHVYERGDRLGPGTLRLVSGDAAVQFRDGTEISVSGPATFGLESESNASLFSGKMLAEVKGDNSEFVVQARSVRVIDRGTKFGVEVGEDGVTEVHCLDGEVETQTRARLPMFYWGFDEANGPPREGTTGQRARMGSGAKRVAGLVGGGAVAFDNTSQAVVNVGNGGGTQYGAGEFGVGSGLTIEVLTIIRWSGDGLSNGKDKDYDELFRKEDGPKRMLLSFQNDEGAHQRTIPKMDAFGPTLSFGLHLAGDGYSELEVRLDGQDGRPSLADLRDEKPHHIVATYDSWTGQKALYIDGVHLQSAIFKEGTLIESGGPTDATIGNMANGGEPYSGVIDEVAIYDFALTPKEVAQHWQNAQRGVNYFGTRTFDEIRGKPWNVTARLASGQAMRFDNTTGLPLGAVPVSYERFRARN